MVLRGGKRERGLAVDQREEARFLAVEELLDHDLGAGGAERAAEAIVDRRVRLPRASAPTTTPLPAASPSALTTIGRLCVVT